MNTYKVEYQVGNADPATYETQQPFFKEAVADAYDTLHGLVNPSEAVLLSVQLVKKAES